MSEQVPEAAELAADPELAADTAEAGEADAGVAAERDRLARLLRETRLQLTMTQARLSALEQSATLELGRTLVRAARRPWSRGAQLPRDLYRMWRGGGAGQTAPATSPAMLALASAQLSDLAGGGERLLSALTAPGLSARAAVAGAAGPSLVVTGVLTGQACAALGPDAAVHPLLPHDADILLESCGADLVLIQASALLASSPWAYAVDPAGADRGRRLARLIAAARALGKPVIFVRDIPPHLAPGLDWVAASCDVVTDDGLGVQLSRFNPIGLRATRDGQPVYAGVRDPRESPALRALLDTVTEPSGQVTVIVTGDVPWRRLPDLYRSNTLFLTVSPEQALEQRACGARVIMADGEPADLARRLAEAVTAGPVDLAEVTGWLREVYLTQSTAARLGALAGLAGLAPPGGPLISGRWIAVLARADDAGAASELSMSVRRQRLRPAELVVCTGDQARAGVAAALSDLPDVQVVAHEGEDWLRAGAARATAPWAAPWDAGREVPDTYLLDLACARECSRADAVGYDIGTYQYTTFLESPGLARRELLGAGGTPGRPARGGLDVSHGLRLFSASVPTQLGAPSDAPRPRLRRHRPEPARWLRHLAAVGHASARPDRLRGVAAAQGPGADQPSDRAAAR